MVRQTLQVTLSDGLEKTHLVVPNFWSRLHKSLGDFS
jgi:hypothetical protein